MKNVLTDHSCKILCDGDYIQCSDQLGNNISFRTFINTNRSLANNYDNITKAFSYLSENSSLIPNLNIKDNILLKAKYDFRGKDIQFLQSIVETTNNRSLFKLFSLIDNYLVLPAKLSARELTVINFIQFLISESKVYFIENLNTEYFDDINILLRDAFIFKNNFENSTLFYNKSCIEYFKNQTTKKLIINTLDFNKYMLENFLSNQPHSPQALHSINKNPISKTKSITKLNSYKFSL